MTFRIRALEQRFAREGEQQHSPRGAGGHLWRGGFTWGGRAPNLCGCFSHSRWGIHLIESVDPRAQCL